jgi:uncharacterized RmlC-like cupin family protein
VSAELHVRVIRPGQRDAATAQTPGMRRLSGVAASTCGASGIWMGHVTTDAGYRSAAHHHGEVESAIYVVSGRIRMRWGERLEHGDEAGPGDFLFVPAGLIHQEINASDSEAAVMIVARGGQENVVVNVELPEAAAG